MGLEIGASHGQAVAAVALQSPEQGARSEWRETRGRSGVWRKSCGQALEAAWSFLIVQLSVLKEISGSHRKEQRTSFHPQISVFCVRSNQHGVIS